MSVHPRVCGEQCSRRRLLRVSFGSSPRVRGTVCRVTFDDQIPRFIPACAGNRSSDGDPDPCWSVHPRVCGEQLILKPLSRAACGSSPRVRGTGSGFGAAVLGNRFIPACAGNSDKVPIMLDKASVHPRVCGEQQSPPSRIVPDAGSSPRVRGTVGTGNPPIEPFRFIPACAGNSHAVFILPLSQQVHPRVCGEQIAASFQNHVVIGSSPRVRGTANRCSPILANVRFIPACAGNRESGVS